MMLLRQFVRVIEAAGMLALTLSAQSFTTMYNFGSPAYQGTNATTGVTVGPQGELFGITEHGGNWNLGTVYELLAPASPGEPRTEVVLHSFNGTDGEYPLAGLIRAADGSL